MKPLIIVNFKTYIFGKDAVKLAKVCGKVGGGAEIVVAPSIIDTSLIAQDVAVFSQHVDGVDAGAATGHVPAAGLKKVGVVGSLVNHSERRVTLKEIQEAVEKCKKGKLISVVCAESLDKISEVLSVCFPDYIAYEPPTLIGGDVSVTDAEPDVVREAVLLVRKKHHRVKVLCGAGVKSGKDVKAALELGCAGVLVASGVVKADDAEKALKDLVGGAS
jgi:triosephosphate isomerase (TIM)